MVAPPFNGQLSALSHQLRVVEAALRQTQNRANSPFDQLAISNERGSELSPPRIFPAIGAGQWSPADG